VAAICALFELCLTVGAGVVVPLLVVALVLVIRHDKRRYGRELVAAVA
jgi:hypothetical protein